jgi:hypothetical protein
MTWTDIADMASASAFTDVASWRRRLQARRGE